MKCRNCGELLELLLIDLGSAPLSNAYLTPVTLRRPEKWFPLRVLVCESCWLVQAESYSRAAEIFNDEYAYFSSFSDAWLRHSELFFNHVVEELGLSGASFVVEVASNDGYLLQFFNASEIRCVGVEPTASTAAVARAKGIETIEAFFGSALAARIRDEMGEAHLIVANNVIAHVPDPHDFLNGIRILLRANGVATLEFPHLLNLLEEAQFDTIYHEHFAYLSFTALQSLLARNHLQAFRVEELATHGGSLRVWVQRGDTGQRQVEDSVDSLLENESRADLQSREAYTNFQQQAIRVKDELLTFLLKMKSEGRQVAAYGAAAKGNTLLNFAGIRGDLVSFVVDRNPAKQGKYLPGSRIPIVSERRIATDRPDVILILPWNLREEVVAQLDYTREWGAELVTAVPELKFW